MLYQTLPNEIPTPTSITPSATIFTSLKLASIPSPSFTLPHSILRWSHSSATVSRS